MRWARRGPRRGIVPAALCAIALAACAPPIIPPASPPGAASPAKPQAAARLILRALPFSALPGWTDDRHDEALAAWRRSCARLAKRPPGASLGGGGIAGTVGDWQAVCQAASRVRPGAARAFFETRFKPHLATAPGQPDGLFTGYFEAELRGSRRRQGAYRIPLYARPPDLVTVDLGRFRDTWKGRRTAGRVTGGRLVPYESRAAIDGGALGGRGLELAWVDDPVDAFFLHIQGSGRVRLDDGGTIRVGYAGHNGHPYVAIGRELIAAGEIPRDQVSMQTIRAWLAANPARAGEMMARNASYVFFRILKGGGPVGSEGSVLTPGRSLAVDRRHVPLGVPLWLDTTDPRAPSVALRRLVVAQDTGGAIKGPVRGDLFWGFGAAAADAAGRMKERGRYYLLLPRKAGS